MTRESMDVHERLVLPAPGRMGRYRRLLEIGRGGVAVVHAGIVRGPGGFEHLVAIKSLRPGFTQREELVAMILDEARLGAAIRHPNVVQTFDVGLVPDHGPFIVMQYVDGVSLAALMTAVRHAGLVLPPRIVVRIVADVLEGLGAAHSLLGPDGRSLGIVHRDVGPQNVLVGCDGIARVSDFGIAKARDRMTTTHAGVFKGRVAYAAPEHVAGGTVDSRSDLFSVGVVLWEALTGRRLFHGHLATVVRRVQREPIPWVSRMCPELEAFDDLVERAVARDPSVRFATADELLEALHAAAGGRVNIATRRELASFVEEHCHEELQHRTIAIARARESVSPGDEDLLPRRIDWGDEHRRSGTFRAPTIPGSEDLELRRQVAELETLQLRWKQRRAAAHRQLVRVVALIVALALVGFVVALGRGCIAPRMEGRAAQLESE